MDKFRRTTDATAADIEKLIALEDDAKQRAFLIVLNSINNSMIANTETTRDIHTKLEQHLENYTHHITVEEGLFNQGKGIWKIMSWVIGGMQMLIIAASGAIWAGLGEATQTIHSIQVEHAKLETRVKSIEVHEISEFEKLQKDTLK
jgi:hypothetical protein